MEWCLIFNHRYISISYQSKLLFNWNMSFPTLIVKLHFFLSEQPIWTVSYETYVVFLRANLEKTSIICFSCYLNRWWWTRKWRSLDIETGKHRKMVLCTQFRFVITTTLQVFLDAWETLRWMAKQVERYRFPQPTVTPILGKGECHPIESKPNIRRIRSEQMTFHKSNCSRKKR